MDLELQDKVAIVGGASKGLGRACAEVLAQEGAKVVMCSRTQADLEQAAHEIRGTTDADILVFPGDLDHYDTVRALIATTADRFGRLDILVNNSGGPPLAALRQRGRLGILPRRLASHEARHPEASGVARHGERSLGGERLVAAPELGEMGVRCGGNRRRAAL